MIDPVSIGAGAIAKLAFDELAKATVAGAVETIRVSSSLGVDIRKASA